MKRWIVSDSKTLRSVACDTLKEARRVCADFNEGRYRNDPYLEAAASINPIDHYLRIIQVNADLLDTEGLPVDSEYINVYPGGDEVRGTSHF